jgi:phosphoenolpyruvate carboxykinase (GTP)
VNGKAGGRETPVGIVPRLEDLDLSGIDVPREKLAKLFEVNMADWAGEVRDIHESLKPYGRRLPAEIRAEFAKLERQSR